MRNLVYIFVLIAIFGCKPKDELWTTDCSLFWRRDSVEISEIDSPEADLYYKVGHHGPAIENRFFGLRLYYNNSGAVDVYSKSKQQLELEQTLWYSSAEQQHEGFGSDQYKVGATVGLGGIMLWDGEKLVKLVATRGRRARVYTENDDATMEMLARGVPYKSDSIDILLSVTVTPDSRWAKLTAQVQGQDSVVFVTGVNYHSSCHTFQTSHSLGSWGIHPGDVALELAEVGAAIRFDPHVFSFYKNTGDQLLVKSKPTLCVSTELTTVSEREKEINTLALFRDFVNSSEE